MPERIPQSAAIRVPLKAYLSSDHLSPATGKTLAITISKNGAAYGNPSAGATNATEIANGSYYVDLSTTDAGTLGPLFVRGAATGVDAVEIIYNVVTTASTPAQIAAAVWDEINTGTTHNLANSTGKQLRSIASNTDVIYTATAPSQAGMTSTQITLDSGASAVNSVYQWDVLSILSGTGAGQSRIVTAYVGATKLATVDSAWAVQPDATSVFEITPTARTQVVSYIAGQDPATLVLDVAAASHNIASTIGAKINLIGSDTAGVTTLLSRITTSPPTAAAIATAVWTDTTAGDFTTLTSPGKIIFTQLGGAFTTTSSSVFSTAALANGPTGGTAPTADVVAAAVWDLATSGHTTSGTFGAAVTAIKSDTSSLLSTLTTVAGNVTTIVTNTTGTGDANVVSFSSAALAQFFTLDTGEKYAAPYSDAVPGSVVYEIVSNTGIDEARLLTDIDAQLSGAHGAGAWGGSGGGGGLDAAGIRNAIGMAAANLDDQLAAIKAEEDSISTTLNTVAGNVTTIVNQTAGTLDAAGIRAAIGMATANLDGQLAGLNAAILSRLAFTDYAAPLNAVGIRNAIGLATNNLDVQLGLIPTAAQNADKLLGRNVGGSADGVRTVSEALYFLRNKWTIIGGTLTVYAADDSSVAWNGGVSQSSATPVTGIDPA